MIPIDELHHFSERLVETTNQIVSPNLNIHVELSNPIGELMGFPAPARPQRPQGFPPSATLRRRPPGWPSIGVARPGSSGWIRRPRRRCNAKG